MRLEVYCDNKITKLKLTKLDWVRDSSYYLMIILFYLWAHPFLFVCLCLAMITWLVMWEQMWIQVRMPKHRDGAGDLWWEIFPYLYFMYFCNKLYDVFFIM